MTEINIVGAIDKLMIFDHEHYCNIGNDRCKYLSATIQCELFQELLCYGHNPPTNFKCDQCKEAYRKIKEQKKVTENAVPKIFKEEDTIYYKIGKSFLEQQNKPCECEPFQSCEVCAK